MRSHEITQGPIRPLWCGPHKATPSDYRLAVRFLALLSLAIAFGLVLAACWSHLLWKVIERARRSAAAV